MIEQVFDTMTALIPPRESVVERVVQRFLAEWAAAREARARTEARLVAVGAAFEAGAAQLAEAREAQAEIGRQQARQARALARFARSRPASLDRTDQEVGAAAAATRAARPPALLPVSEWAVDEIAVALSLTGSTAGRLLAESLLLVDRLPGTLDALEHGRLGWRHVQVMTDLVAPLSDDLRGIGEERLLSGLADKTPPQLRAAARRVVQRLDAEAISRRVAEAVRGRRVTVYPGDDGMSTLSATLPTPVARAVQSALEQYADAAAVEGDERTRAQRMVDCLVDLVLRPGEHGLAPVQAQLTVVATIRTLLGDDEPGEVDGDLVPAEMVRELAYALGLLPRPDGESTEPPEASETADTPESADAAVDAPRQADTPGPADLLGLADLLGTRTLRDTALAHRPQIALADDLTGQLLALTDAAELRAGRGLGPPPESPGYRPDAALDRFVRLRDRRCRFPGCRARERRDDLDHTVPWPAGPTSPANLAALCRHHHRLRHQAPGWRLRGLDDGGLEWTTPTGQVLVTHPPRHGADDDLPAPSSASAAAGRRPAPADDRDHDPPPF
jgi:hypothetical protein